MARRLKVGLDGIVQGYVDDSASLKPNSTPHALLGKSWQDIMRAPVQTRKEFSTSHPFEFEKARREFYIGHGVPMQPLEYTPTTEDDLQRMREKVDGEKRDAQLRRIVEGGKQ